MMTTLLSIIKYEISKVLHDYSSWLSGLTSAQGRFKQLHRLLAALLAEGRRGCDLELRFGKVIQEP